MFGFTDQRRRRFIDEYTFPPGVTTRFGEGRRGLNDEQTQLAFDGLREWFQLCRENREERCFLAMPSVVVDDAWHTFILFTVDYHAFCRRAFGNYLHHAPAEAFRDGGKSHREFGLVETWVAACRWTGTNATTATALPVLFTVDALTGATNGCAYRVGDLRRAARADHDARRGDLRRSSAFGGCGGGVGGDGGGGGGGCGAGCGGGG